MKWGITGGSGQLAGSLTELLNIRGVEHVAWSHSELDVADSSSIETIVNYKPTVLVNCAAWTNVDGAEDAFEEALKVNRDGAKNIAIAAKELNIPLIHISTDYVFSGNSTRPWKVEDATGPTSKYGESKLLGEFQILGTWPEKSSILRTAWLYGPYGKNFAKTILKKAISTKNVIEVVHDQKGQPTTTNDLAAKIIECVSTGIPHDLYHATNSGESTWWEFARELVMLGGESVDRITPVTSGKFPSKTKRPKYSVLDHSAWSKVGLEPMRDWREALREIFPSIREQVEKELSNG
jgi:dTDP-4-dehydrorhamnose reductase